MIIFPKFIGIKLHSPIPRFPWNEIIQSYNNESDEIKLHNPVSWFCWNKDTQLYSNGFI